MVRLLAVNNIVIIDRHTKFPASLHETNLRVVNKEWDGSPEEVRLGLEVSVEDGNVVAAVNIAVLHPFFQRPCLVTVPVPPDLVFDVNPFACPSMALRHNHILHLLYICHSHSH